VLTTDGSIVSWPFRRIGRWAGIFVVRHVEHGGGVVRVSWQEERIYQRQQSLPKRVGHVPMLGTRRDRHHYWLLTDSALPNLYRIVQYELGCDKQLVGVMGDGRACVVLLWETRAMSEQTALVLAGSAQAASSEHTPSACGKLYIYFENEESL
jgi:hypothetical protein